MPEVLRGGDTTSCKQKNCPIKLVPSSQDDESSKGNGNSADRSRKGSKSPEKKRRKKGKMERERCFDEQKWMSQIQKVKSYVL